VTILITGGAGFIGSNFILDWLDTYDETVINLDKLTYAGNLENLATIEDKLNYEFIRGDISNQNLIETLLSKYQPRAIVNFAAESHVDRSIHGPANFVQTNVLGTFNLLEATRAHWTKLTGDQQQNFRFLHVSTDEVYGSLEQHAPPFTESHPYQPNSPYSATKASSDHLVRAYYHTYDMPMLTTNCSNNYGPYQFPEKLIPLVILNALAGQALPIYGDGKQVRDWLFVGDHCSAICTVLEKGQTGEVYNIGGLNEMTNMEIVLTLCTLLDNLRPRADGASYSSQITHVTDRPGHDRRYAIDATKIHRELNWKPAETFGSGIKKTVNWYLNNESWVTNVTSGEYRNWVEKHYQ
jgi:dTDP-glucose 4,6-dehydratase